MGDARIDDAQPGEEDDDDILAMLRNAVAGRSTSRPQSAQTGAAHDAPDEPCDEGRHRIARAARAGEPGADDWSGEDHPARCRPGLNQSGRWETVPDMGASTSSSAGSDPDPAARALASRPRPEPEKPDAAGDRDRAVIPGADCADTTIGSSRDSNGNGRPVERDMGDPAPADRRPPARPAAEAVSRPPRPDFPVQASLFDGSPARPRPRQVAPPQAQGSATTARPGAPVENRDREGLRAEFHGRAGPRRTRRENSAAASDGSAADTDDGNVMPAPPAPGEPTTPPHTTPAPGERSGGADGPGAQAASAPRDRPRAGPGRSRKTAAADALAGHRQRLRARFDRGEALQDYELMELMLFRSIPRRDTKPLAKTLVATFGSFAAALAAPAHRLKEIEGIGDAVVSDFRIVRAAAERFAKESLAERDTLSSTEAVVDYYRTKLRAAEREEFHVLYLDKKNRFLASERAQVGTVDHTPVYPREVLKRALEHGASAIVLVHNHPSGDPTPSRADVAMTRKIVEATAAVGIAVHDHLIIGRNEHTSLRTEGLMVP